MFSLSSFVFGCSEPKDIKFQENGPRASLGRFMHLTLLRYNRLICLRKSNATGRFAENRLV